MDIVFRDIDDIVMLDNIGILKDAGTIGHRIITTDLVLNSFGDNAHIVYSLINEKKITVISFNGQDVFEIKKIYDAKKNQISIADCSTIYCTKIMNGILITNEQILLNISATYNLKSYTAIVYFEKIKLLNTG